MLSGTLKFAVSALIACSISAAAVTNVTLSPSATPTAADPVATTVTVTGHDFPSGTILPANVTVTLNPATAGAGPSGTTTASKVTAESGTTERVSFIVPKFISVPVATPYEVSISGTTSAGKKFQSSNTAALTVNALVSITTNSLPAATVGITYSQTLSANGGTGQYNWQVSSGSLPAGLTLNAASGLVSGKPTASGTSNCVFKVTDSDQSSTSKKFTVAVDPALAITSSSPLPTGTVNVSYSQTLTATGGSGQYTWSVSAGALPAGLTLNAGTGAITGQPTTAGAPSFTILVTDTNQATATKPFSMTVNLALVITTASPLPTGTIGVAYAKTLAATGGSGQYTWSVSAGALPAGLTLNAATGAISGQPTTAGSPSFTIEVTDSNQAATTKPFTVTVNPALAITTSSPLPTGTVGVNYSQTLAATGGSGQYTWSVSAGSLPAGLTLNAATGAITGQPTAAGAPGFTIQVTDSNQVTATKPFSLTINPALAITTSSPLPAGTIGVNYSQTLMATGGSGQYTWSVTVGALPGGLTLNSSSGLISGQPNAAGAPSFTIQVNDTNQVITTKVFSVTIDPAIVITTASPLPPGEVGVNYTETLGATGGSGQYTWSVSSGALPAGLTLTAATGIISGTPTTAATSNFTILATDTNQATASQSFGLTVNPAAQILSMAPKSANAGISLQVTITGSDTHFAQGTTQANFGSGISVTSVTVDSLTSAVAQISIGSSATVGSRSVTVTTGTEQATLSNGFSVAAAVPVINVNTAATNPLAPGFSGFDDEYLVNGVEYWDPKYIAMVQPLKPGWIRYPSGTPSMGFDWQASDENLAWIGSLGPLIGSYFTQTLEKAQLLAQAKGGAAFADYGTLLQTVGANGLVVFNGYTDTTPDSAYKMALAAAKDGINMVDWELDNEPYIYTSIYATPADYCSAMYNPYYTNIAAAVPSAKVGVFYQGEFNWQQGNYVAWDSGMAAYSPQYWNSVSFHVYPITDSTIDTTDEEETLNGILAHGTTEYFSSYVQPLIGTSTPVFISELNSGTATMAFESYIYNAVFLAEYVARMTTIPQVKAVGVSEPVLG